jgi:hypothetical protein
MTRFYLYLAPFAKLTIHRKSKGIYDKGDNNDYN